MSLNTQKSKPSALKSFVSGACGGFCLVFAAHPFDLIKVRMQTSAPGKYSSSWDALRFIIKHDGVRGMYRGVSPVLAVSPPILALNFWAYFMGQQLVHFLSTGKSNDAVSQDDLTLVQIGLAGSLSSIPSSIFIGPAEQIKIRLQIQETKLNKARVGAFGMAGKIMKEEGARALFRGTGLTLLRDVPTGFAYFVTYEGFKKYFRRDDDSISMGAVMFAGGMAGVINWTLAIPIDTIKSRIQSGGSAGISQTIQILLKESGPKGLFRGLAPTLLRAFPASAAFFFGVETSSRLWDKFQSSS